jgi:hypothetical protein
MRRRTSMAVAIAGIAAVIGLLAGPASAQTSGPGTSGGARATTDSVASGTCVAVNDSVCSGSGTAVNDSTSSGSAHARDGSVSSGCATAINDSTASGAPCPPAGPATTVTTRPGPGGTTATTRPATASAPRALALTGSSTADLALLALGALVLGGLLVLAGNRRPQEG